jgi:hypothetical protein
VVRAAELNDGRIIVPGATFSAGVNLFGYALPDAETWIRRAFEMLAQAGLGAGRGRAELIAAEAGVSVSVEVEGGGIATEQFEVEFLTPTDLKTGGEARADPEFSTVFARARDRVSALMTMYGTGSPEADYRALGEAANSIRTAASDIQRAAARRRSSRTGQVHEIGGFIGSVRYEGDAAPFSPWLRAAYWTGIGRHTVWGNGVIRVTESPHTRDRLGVSCF